MENMNWVNLIANASVTLLMLSVAGWQFRRWVANVDEGIKDNAEASHRIELTLANLSNVYTIKDDFNSQKSIVPKGIRILGLISMGCKKTMSRE